MNIQWLIPPQPVDDELLEFYLSHVPGCAMLDNIEYRCTCQPEITEQELTA